MRMQDTGPWRHITGTKDAATGDVTVMFELVRMSVIHTGMAMHFIGLYLRHPEFISGQFVELPCTFYYEGGAPGHSLIKGILHPI